MGLTASPGLAPAGSGLLIPGAAARAREHDPIFGAISDELADKGFLVTTTDDLHPVGAHGIAHVDDFRPRLLRGRDDAAFDAAV